MTRTRSHGESPFARLALIGTVVALSILVLAPATGAAQYEKGECHSDSAPDKSDEHERMHQDERKPAKENCDTDRVRDDKERERMERYLEEFVDRDTIVNSFELEDGDIVDCVDVFRQPALRRPELKGHELMFKPSSEPEKELDEESNERCCESGASSFAEDPRGRAEIAEGRQLYGSNGELCPEKTVPIRRPTMDILRNFETLDDYFSKEPPHLVNGPNNLHQYAHAYRSVSNWGAQTTLNVWSPYTERSSEFSLSQLWVVRGSGSNLETVEAGWQKYRDLYGDYRPRLFIYFTPDNYGSGGCYNLSCGAFVQVNNSVYIGGGFSNISQHPHPSTAWEFTLRWQKDGTEGHWWLKYGNTWVGYYPRSKFDANGLRDRASEIDFGGEIIDRQPGGRHTYTDMGSGHFPGDGFGYAAYQRRIRYITTNNFWGMRPSLTASRSDRDCYDISVHNSSGSWERYFYFGGPGYNSHCR